MKDLLVSVEEYISTTYEPDCEYVDGILVERNVGERDHSYWQIKLGSHLEAHEDDWGIYAFTEWRVQVKPTRFRVPDLTVVTGDWPADPVLKRPPFLVIEIFSPDDKQSELQRKIRDYLEFGIPYTLVIYPDQPRFVLFTPAGEREILDGVLRTQNPALEIPLMEIFTNIRRKSKS